MTHIPHFTGWLKEETVHKSACKVENILKVLDGVLNGGRLGRKESHLFTQMKFWNRNEQE